MATFKFGRQVNIHWNGFDVKGPADTVFSIPDQLYEEFESDIRGVEPSLTWIDTNEFQTLTNEVSTAALSATFPVAIATSTTGKTISLSSSTNPNGYLMVADGSGGVIFTPASTSGLTSVVGVSPISAIVQGGTVSVSLDANYQTAGTYVTGVVGTSPISASGTTSITVTIDQALITGATAAENAETLRHYVKNTTGTTIPLGSAVYISGATGDNALISLATASTEVGSSKTLGITAESIANDAFGYVIEAGYLAGIDTTSTTAGASVWLGNTPGSLVFGAPPAEPSHSVYLGVVIREQLINGSLLVKVQNGYELDELHDVSAASPSDGDILQYKTSSSMWTKASISNAGIASSVHTHDYQASGNYQTAGTYVNAVVGTSPASVSTASGTATVSIVSGSINSTHIADNAIVAAKIASNAVGITKIDSGSATNGYVLTANGTGGASFLPFSSAALEINAATYTVINGALVTSVYNSTSPFTAIGTVSPSIAFDESSNTVFQCTARNVIKSFSAVDGSAISSATITAIVANEMIDELAFGASTLIAITSLTASGGASKYYIIDPSALTVKNSGNLVPSGETITSQGEPKVRYDYALGEFVVLGAYGTSATSVQTGGYVRTIHPSTYSTRVHKDASWENVWGDGTRSFPIWISVDSANRWAFGQNGQLLEFYSDSGAATQFMTRTGSADFGSSVETPQLWIDPSDNTNLLGLFVSETSGNLSTIYNITFSQISAAYNTLSVSVTLPSGQQVDNMSSNAMFTFFKTVNGRQWLVHPHSGVMHIYASTRTSNAKNVNSNFLTVSPWNVVNAQSNADFDDGGSQWAKNWTDVTHVGHDGTEFFVIHGSSNTAWHGVVKQKLREVQSIDVVGTSVSSISMFSPGAPVVSGSYEENYRTNPSNILASFNTGIGNEASNALYLLGTGSTWTWDIYPTFVSSSSNNFIVSYPGRMIIRS